MRVAMLLALLGAVVADVYMQVPSGSNNRLDEGGGNRNNNNRLMDTQNNAKGGYGYGGSADNKAAPLSYMVGSKLSATWTSQHSCGSENAECQVVIQYMCNDAQATPAGLVAPTDTAPNADANSGPLRDGTNGNSPDPNQGAAANANRGLHEPVSFYNACNGRERNKGLYTADQNLNADDATRTRQNPNGGRSALECPEERDYYPYWAPSPWKDLMVMTNNLALCQWYKDNSQNVAARGYCKGGATNNLEANNQAACTAAAGTWHVVPPFGIAAPECVTAPVTRDNHLGNTATGNEVMANLTIPASAGGVGVNDAANCVIRLRYNITTGDTRACSLPGQATKAACEAAGGIWSAMYLTAADNIGGNNNGATAGKPPPGNPTVGQDLGLNAGGGTDSLLELAINTNQYGRTFQDRSHVFSVESRPASVAANMNIYNLNVKGKRGNIVQTYPATEYDFHPVDLEVGAQDAIHIQWTGNDNTNNNGNNNGEGVDNEDRHNIVQLANSGEDVPAPKSQASMFDVAWEWNPEATGTFAGPRTKDNLVKQFALAKQTGCAANPNNDQQRDNCEKLNSAAATVNLGLLRMKPGQTYRYMSSRNNNFSNRAQKARIGVSTSPSALTMPPTHVEAIPIVNQVNDAQGIVEVTWLPPGDESAYVGTDGKPYVGYSQEALAAQSYKVQYSCDGGVDWISAPDGCVIKQPDGAYKCRVEMLPAGTPCAFRVRSGSYGGWSAPSALGVALTAQSEASLECTQKLIDQVNGQYLSPGATAAIIVAVIAAIALAICLAWYFMCGGANTFRRAPPPPPGGKFEIPPPPAGGQAAY